MDLFLEYEETFDVTGCGPEDLHTVGERVMDALLALEGGQDHLTDSTVSIDAEEMTITVEIGIGVPDGLPRAQAEIAVRSAARSAFHAVGAATPGWEFERQASGGRTELVSA